MPRLIIGISECRGWRELIAIQESTNEDRHDYREAYSEDTEAYQ